MACFKPMYRADVDSHPERISLLSVYLRREVCPHNGGIFLQSGSYDLLPETLKEWFVPIPCGYCSGCVIDYSKQWAARCLLEAREHEHNYFVTLTYNDANLPEGGFVEPVNGEYVETELCKADLQKFMKRLRKNVSKFFGIDGIRFLACGEYGSKGHRPHYHLCLLGMPDLTDQLKLWSVRDGVNLYRCDFIEKAWCRKDGSSKGFVTVGEVTWQSACYVARYVVKKRQNHVKRSDRLDLLQYWEMRKADDPSLSMDVRFPQSEFLLMSRRPGLAKGYFDEHKEAIYQNGTFFIKVDDKAVTMKPLKYFDYLYDIEDPDRMSGIKLKRQEVAKETQREQLERAGLDQREYERLCDERQKRKNRRLVRK